MKVLITGSEGFIGRNLVATLQEKDNFELFLYDRENSLEDLQTYVLESDFIIHLAGVNRPKDPKDFYKGNSDLTTTICNILSNNDKKTPIFLSSSIQAAGDNDYGKSKSLAENALIDLNKSNSNPVYIYRLPNLFGKWSRPFYNSVVATWCYQVSHDEEITVNDRSVTLELLYIDDLIKEIFALLSGNVDVNDNMYYSVKPTYETTLGELADTILSFRDSRNNLFVPDMGNELVKALYSTYLSYLPIDSFSYDLKMNVDDRGSFTEFVKSETSGQVSINVSKPGITKGEHWHHTKNEKFLVVSGEGLIRFRNIFSEEIIDYKVSGNKLEVVDIPTGYTHNIINIGDVDLVTVMWVNEPFDPKNPDTFYNKVDK